MSYSQQFPNNETNEEQDWLENGKKLLSKEELQKNDYVSWAAYQVTQTSFSSQDPRIISLLPMFTENAHSLAIIAHSMRVISAAVVHVNPSQTPVIAVDKPLFPLAKVIQWRLGTVYDENWFVFMLGGLYVEIGVLENARQVPHWYWMGRNSLQCWSGDTGVAASLLTASHLSQTRRAHQVTIISLSHVQSIPGIRFWDWQKWNSQNLSWMEKGQIKQMSTASILVWHTGLAVALSSACESLWRSRLFVVRQNHKADSANVCIGPSELCSLVVCALMGYVWAPKKTSRSVYIVHEWQFRSSQDQKFVFCKRPRSWAWTGQRWCEPWRRCGRAHWKSCSTS